MSNYLDDFYNKLSEEEPVYVCRHSSSNHITVQFDLINGEKILFMGVGSCGEGYINDYYHIDISVSPRELGMAGSIDELIDLLKKRISDDDRCFFDRSLWEGFDITPENPVMNNYRCAQRVIDDLKNLGSMDEIESVTIIADERNEVNYYREYKYNRISGVYSKIIRGRRFEIYGGSGGDLRFSDEAMADPSIGANVPLDNPPFLNFLNKTFVLTGFTDAKKNRLVREIKNRGGRVEDTVTNDTYCLIVNADFGFVTKKCRDVASKNYWSYSGRKHIYTVDEDCLRRLMDMPTDKKELTAADLHIVDGVVLDVPGNAVSVDMTGPEITDINCDAFVSCRDLKRVTGFPLESLDIHLFEHCPLETLALRVCLKKVNKHCFMDGAVPDIITPVMGMYSYDDSTVKRIAALNYIREVRDGVADTELSDEYKKYIKSQRKYFFESNQWELVAEYMVDNRLLSSADAAYLKEKAAVKGNSKLVGLLDAYTPEKKSAENKTSESKNWLIKSLKDGTVCIRMYKGLETEITVPETLRGKAVSEIGPLVFSPDAEGLNEEQRQARRQLTVVTLPKELKYFSTKAFLGCDSLSRIDFSSDKVVPRLMNGVNSEDPSYVLRNLKNYKLPNVYYSLKYCFHSCSDLKELDIPQGVESIGALAFWYSSTLERVSIPGTVARLCESSFSFCKKLREVQLSEGLDIIEAYTFFASEMLKHITLPNTLTYIGDEAFWGCDSLESIVIPDSVTELGDKVFGACKRLRHVKLPKGIKTLPSNTFLFCDSMEELVIPDGVERIAEIALPSKAKHIYIPSSVKIIEGQIFQSNRLTVHAPTGSEGARFAKAKMLNLIEE